MGWPAQGHDRVARYVQAAHDGHGLGRRRPGDEVAPHRARHDAGSADPALAPGAYDDRELLFNTTQRHHGAQTLAAVSMALGWPPGYLRAVAEGHGPGDSDAGVPGETSDSTALVSAMA
jgi:hypothetical protein